jgi:peptide/nickel transport system permease protein
MFMFAGVFIFATLVVMAAFAPALAPYPYDRQSLIDELKGPSAGHPLGQDKLGRDVLSRIIHGARVSLLVGLLTVCASFFTGLAIGTLAGYRGGWVDNLLMRIVDILQAFPGILLAIALAAVLGPSLRNVILALSVLGWIGYARVARGQVMAIRERDYVQAATALGAGGFRVVARHVIPNIMSPMIVQVTFGMAAAIMGEASLSFLGLGTQGTPSWGGMLNEGLDFLGLAPHLSLFPGLALMITVLGLNLLGDGLRDRLDPKERT